MRWEFRSGKKPVVSPWLRWFAEVGEPHPLRSSGRSKLTHFLSLVVKRYRVDEIFKVGQLNCHSLRLAVSYSLCLMPMQMSVRPLQVCFESPQVRPHRNCRSWVRPSRTRLQRQTHGRPWQQSLSLGAASALKKAQVFAPFGKGFGIGSHRTLLYEAVCGHGTPAADGLL